MQDKLLWDDAYSLGIEEIDTQHKHLFEIANRIFTLKSSSKVKEDIRDILYELSDYVKEHFKDEEDYMSSINFPYLEDHKQEHQKIIGIVGSILDNNHRLDTIQTKMRMIAKRALVEHILHEDMKIKVYQESLDEEDLDSEEYIVLD